MAEVGRRAVALVALLCGVKRPVGRMAYLAAGIGLAAFKFAVEVLVIHFFTGRLLDPVTFLSPSVAAREDVLQGAPQGLALALVAWNLPFLWVAVSMSVRRAIDAGRSPWLGLGVLLPYANLAAMVILAALPSRGREHAVVDGPEPDEQEGPRAQEAIWADSIAAIAAAVLVGMLALVISVYGFGAYGLALFFATPLVMGAVAGFRFNRSVDRGLLRTFGLGAVTMLVAGGFLIAAALEGLICLLMAAPIVMPLAILGAAVGWMIATRCTSGRLSHVATVALTLPLIAAVDAVPRPLPERCVYTAVEVDAPPEVVWRHVVSFPDLPPPEDWFFRCGIACPLRASIDGTGVGAVRHCEFTTGDFVEPITAWEEPERLAFDVADQPDPMVELSPWRHVHPPHLHDRSLESRRGEFRLVRLEGSRTRLEGRTWYTFDMHPRGYWTLLGDFSIHRIHVRVLEHIRHLSEAEAGRSGNDPRGTPGRPI